MPDLRDVTIVLPAHREEGAIGAVVRRCLSLPDPPREVLVIDDGSSDRTGEEAAGAGARVVRLACNSGKGAALRRGVDEARTNLVVVMDADGQDDPDDVPSLVAELRRGADLVVGSRFLGRFEPGAIQSIDRTGTVGLTRLFNALYGTRLTDVLAGFRAARRDVLSSARLRATGYAIEVDMLAAVLRSGGRIEEVPVRRLARRYGQSGLRRFRDGVIIAATMLRGRVEGSSRNEPLTGE